MKMRHRVAAVAAAAGLAAGSMLVAAPAAQAVGENSLYSILEADLKRDGTPSFDDKGRDFDILTAAVQAVLEAKPTSPVALLADGSVKLTAFLPTDRAFARTGEDLGFTARTESRLVTKYVAALGSVDALEAVLLYHVVAGVKITSTIAAASDGALLKTAAGQGITVNVTDVGIYLRDANRDVPNPKVTITDINRGNMQIAHGISRVLLPSLG